MVPIETGRECYWYLALSLCEDHLEESPILLLNMVLMKRKSQGHNLRCADLSAMHWEARRPISRETRSCKSKPQDTATSGRPYAVTVNLYPHSLLLLSEWKRNCSRGPSLKVTFWRQTKSCGQRDGRRLHLSSQQATWNLKHLSLRKSLYFQKFKLLKEKCTKVQLSPHIYNCTHKEAKQGEEWLLIFGKLGWPPVCNLSDQPSYW